MTAAHLEVVRYDAPTNLSHVHLEVAHGRYAPWWLRGMPFAVALELWRAHRRHRPARRLR